MSTQTENISLTMPTGTEHYSLSVNNANLQSIDAALGTLQATVGTGTGLTEKVGESTDTAAGTLFGDLHIIDGKATANGTAISNVKTVADANAVKLNNLKGVTDNTKTVADIVNTNTETVKANVSTILTRTATINTNAATAATKAGTIEGKLDTVDGIVDTINADTAATRATLGTVSAKVNTINSDSASVKQQIEYIHPKIDSINGKIGANTDAVTSVSIYGKINKLQADLGWISSQRIGEPTNTGNSTVFGVLNQLKSTLATMTSNMTTLLAQSKGVKNITRGMISGGNGTVTMPSGTNMSKLVITCDTGGTWNAYSTISGNVITFECGSESNIYYQIVEFY